MTWHPHQHLVLSVFWILAINVDFPGVSVVKNPPSNAGDKGSIPMLG